MVSEVNSVSIVNKSNTNASNLGTLKNNRYLNMLTVGVNPIDVAEDDEKSVEYAITTDCSISSSEGYTNAASKILENASKYKQNTCEVLQTIVNKCQKEYLSMKDFQDELDALGAEVNKKTDENGKVIVDTQTSVSDYQAKLQEKLNEIQEKKIQIRENNKLVHEGEKDANSANSENKQLEADIEKISNEIGEYKSSLNDNIASARSTISSNGTSMQNVVNKAQSALSDAVNSDEIADLAVQKGTELIDMCNNLTPSNVQEQLKNSGFAADGSNVNQLFQGLYNANFLGTVAVNQGSALGKSVTVVANQVKNISGNYGINVECNSTLQTIASKAYK